MCQSHFWVWRDAHTRIVRGTCNFLSKILKRFAFPADSPAVCPCCGMPYRRTYRALQEEKQATLPLVFGEVSISHYISILLQDEE
jgi:hypothetical protein